MPKKKITAGYSSKNGQKQLIDSLNYGELSNEQAKEIRANPKEISIDFPASKISDFERMVYQSCEIIEEFQKSQGRNLEPNHHLESFKREVQDEFLGNVEKLYLLLDHYGIDPNDEYRFVLLSIELARELFPTSRTQGPKTKWSKSVEAIFVIDMERLTNEGKTIRNAGIILARDPIWSSFMEARETGSMAESMRTEYSKIRKKSHIEKSRIQFDQMTQTEFEKQKKLLVRNLPTF